MRNDPIADMLIRIKNAGAVGKSSVVVPFSNFKMAIADLLLREGFVKSLDKKGKKAGKFIEIELFYGEDGSHRINGIKRVSKFSKRVYRGAKDLKPIKGGYGVTVISSPTGILTDKQAKQKNVGGEVLFEIW